MTKKLPGTKMPVARFFRTNLYPFLGVLNPTKEMESQLSRLQPAGGTLCLPVWHAHQSSRDPESGGVQYIEIEDRSGAASLQDSLGYISKLIGIPIKHGEFTREDMGLPPLPIFDQHPKLMRVCIHSGGLSADNGAHGPLNILFTLPKITDHPASVLSGAGYWDDRLEIDARDWPAIESILIDAKMLYRLEGEIVEGNWRNIQTDVVRMNLGLSPRGQHNADVLVRDVEVSGNHDDSDFTVERPRP